MKRLCFLVIAFFSLFNGLCQTPDILTSRTTSYYTNLYRISKQQIKAISKKGGTCIDESFFEDIVAYYPTDSLHLPDLEDGTYLKAWAEGSKLWAEVVTVSGLEVEVLNNSSDLQIVLRTSAGRLVKEARLVLSGRKIPYDEKTQTFRHKHSNRHGLLEVLYNGQTHYFLIERNLNNPKVTRTVKKVIYSTPLKFITVPAQLVLMTPVDLVKTITHIRRPSGIFYYVSKPAVDIYRTIRFKYPHGFISQIACLFDPTICGRDVKEPGGYLVFSKPMFKPGDTLRWKAFITKPNGKPYGKTLSLWIGKDSWRTSDRKQLGTISPQPKGVYYDEIILSDSLDLQLDKDYRVSLVKGKYNTIIYKNFPYKIYELKGMDLKVRTDNSSHHPGQTQEIHITGKDINGLNLLDATLELNILAGAVDTTFSRHVYIPDTLWYHTTVLDQEKETIIALPDSVFPPANIHYKATVRLLSSDNESAQETIDLTYKHFNRQITAVHVGDSVRFTFDENGQSVPASGKIQSFDGNGRLMESFEVSLPCTLPFNGFTSTYQCSAGNINETIKVADWDSGISVSSYRDRDSVRVRVYNPHDIPLNFNFYRKNREIKRGKATKLALTFKNSTRKNYFLSIQYFWAGEAVQENFDIGLLSKQLNIDVIQPESVFPGQTQDISVVVYDKKNRPVKDVDVTAFGISGKFTRYRPPEVPQFSRTYKGRMEINSFQKEESLLKKEKEDINLNWQYWSAKMGLDSISYFNFLYPGSKLFYSYSRMDSSSCQIAPFVVEQGEQKPVHIVYIDERPVYFSMTQTVDRYSFNTTPGWHHVRLRTTDKEITIDSVLVREAGKTIVSIDPSSGNPRTKVLPKENKLTRHEISLAYRYLIRIKTSRNDARAFVEQGNKLYWVNDRFTQNYFPSDYRLTGPLYSDQVANYVLSGSFETPFSVESNYSYEFAKGLIKMKSPMSRFNHESLVVYEKNGSITDLAVTEEEIKNYLDKTARSTQRLSTYNYPTSTQAGYGRLKLLLQSQVESRLVNLVLIHDTSPQFVQAYPGVTLLHNLPKGTYTLYGLLDGGDFFDLKASITRDGLTIVTVGASEIRKFDDTSLKILSLLASSFEAGNYHQFGRQQDLKNIRSEIITSKRADIDGIDVISGFITDADSGEPMPGVNVVVKGTNIGTVSDVSGYYSLNIPSDTQDLIFSFIGFVTEEVSIGYQNQLDVSMYADVKQLQEVVVVGMSVESRKAVSASYSTVSSVGFNSLLEPAKLLQGKIAGVQMAESGVVTIRGANSVSASDSPLFVVNGIPFQQGELEIDPAEIISVRILKADQGQALYGARGAQGVVVITTSKTQNKLGATEDQSLRFASAQSDAKSIRSNFKDDAFWAPSMMTDKNGIARFTATFPDDITLWKTHYLAMGRKKQSGQWDGEIRSFKPVAGTLAVPGFLVAGDSALIIGKTLNYLGDTVNVKSHFQINNSVVGSFASPVEFSRIDTTFVHPIDTGNLKITYVADVSETYKDGEERTVRVLNKGVFESHGSFYVLSGDTTLTIVPSKDMGPVKVYAKSTPLESMLDEIEHIERYPYLCNEQAASKLTMLLAKKRIFESTGQVFKDKRKVEELIERLEKANNKQLLWGWWKDNETVYWISAHVLRALIEAQNMGFSVKLDKQTLVDLIIPQMISPSEIRKIELLELLYMLGAKLDYGAEIQSLLTTSKLDFTDTLRTVRLQQSVGIRDFSIDSLLSKALTTSLGEMYWTNPKSSISANSIQTTLLAYEILMNESGFETELDKIELYLLNQRKNSHWVNTFTSTQILAVILPRMLGKHPTRESPRLLFGKEKETPVTKFPLEIILSQSDTLFVAKSGLGTIYFTAYQQQHKSAPEAVNESFQVITRFENGDNTLIGGMPEKLIVEVCVSNISEYVMLEVPIPAGCSYENRRKTNQLESHREYLLDKASIFCQKLPVGKHIFEIELLPRFTGTYTLNPAKVELMYFPTFFGRGEMKKVKIVSR